MVNRSDAKRPTALMMDCRLMARYYVLINVLKITSLHNFSHPAVIFVEKWIIHLIQFKHLALLWCKVVLKI